MKTQAGSVSGSCGWLVLLFMGCAAGGGDGSPSASNGGQSAAESGAGATSTDGGGASGGGANAQGGTSAGGAGGGVAGGQGSDAAAGDASAPDAGPPLGCPAGSGAGPLGGARPTPLKIPAGYTPAKQYPLVLELAGRGGTGVDAEAAFKMGAMADANQIFVIAPTGTLDAPPPPTAPATFWNATDACCDMYGSGVDDVAYLRSLICHTQANYSIDPNKVFIIGGSNGAFMAHRMACDAADLVTAIIAISGVVWNDPNKCKPVYPVSVLQIHGTADPIVPFNGTSNLFWGPSPSAPATYATWAQLNHCTGTDVQGPAVDFDTSVDGSETTTLWKPIQDDCKVATQLWAVNGGTHVMGMTDSTRKFFIDWFKATPPNHP